MGYSHPDRPPRSGGKGLRLFGFLAAALSLVAAASAAASPAIVIDVASGDVLYEEQATQPWYPASLTKLMSVYVALSAVRDHQISLDTPLVVSRRAASMAPSKMGFVPGTEVTLENALKMMMVKSANDIAVTVAEGIAGSVEAFAEDMNHAAAQLGMTESHFVNPNGLHDPDHYSSARDFAILARAIYINFPDFAGLFDIGALRLGDEIIPTHNNMLGRYPGADGMKTGFTCAAGFNLVASATRGGHHYVAVVLGAPTIKLRLIRTAVLFDRAFDGIDHPHPWSTIAPTGETAPDMHNGICRNRNKAIIKFEAETERLEAPLNALPVRASPVFPLFNSAALTREAPIASRIAMVPAPIFDPVPVYIGPAPGYEGPVAEARPPHSPIGTPPVITAADTEDKTQAAATGDAASAKKGGKFAERHEQDEEDEEDTTPAPKVKAKKHWARTAAAEKPPLGNAAEAKTHKVKAKEASAGKAKTAKAGKAKAIAASKVKTPRTASKAKAIKVGWGNAKTTKIAVKKIKPAKLAAKPKPTSAQD
jgi:D-alanyl-D-alanine carboxypeptidase